MRHPRIIHRVWLGPRQPSPRNVGFTEAWQRLHPNWLVKVWDDETVEALRPLTRDSLFAIAPTWVHRADLVRMEVVYRFGGLYCDFDMEPVRNVEPLIEDSDGWTTPDADGFPGNAFFGAAPEHPGMLKLLRTVGGVYTTPNRDTGPYHWGRNSTLDLLGSRKTAYPVHWSEKHRLRDFQPGEDTYVIHHFDGSWTA